jgi:alpha-ketoglutarate-dependent taurine dioxygenase
MEEPYPNPTHPVVRTRPISVKKAVFVNPQIKQRIKGLKAD